MQLKILRLIDVFGVEVGLKYEGRQKYTSRTGGFITLIVGCILCSLLYQQCSQMYNKQTSTISYQQTYVDIPSRYDITSNKFAFMIGLIDKNNIPVMDNAIYSLTATLIQKVLADPNIPGKFVFTNIPLSIGVCSEEDFTMTEAQGYFLQQSLDKVYCLKNQSELFLQGQFDKEVFSQVRIQVLECNNQTFCKSPDERQNIIKTATVQIYYTDRIMELQNFDSPFRVVGKTQFYNIFYDFTLSTDFIFSNTHVIDDTGLLREKIQISTDLVFVQDRYQLVSKVDNQIFEVNLYLEKDKEDTYTRKYMKLPELLSQLSGTFQALFFVGYIFLRPYNNSKLQKRLYKDIYSPENQEKNGDNILFSSIQKTQLSQKKEKEITLNQASEIKFDKIISKKQQQSSYFRKCLKRLQQRLKKENRQERIPTLVQSNHSENQNLESAKQNHSISNSSIDIKLNHKKVQLMTSDRRISQNIAEYHRIQ